MDSDLRLRPRFLGPTAAAAAATGAAAAEAEAAAAEAEAAAAEAEAAAAEDALRVTHQKER
jgi:hypothetical protein